MDFYKISEYSPRKGYLEIFPDFIVGRSKDIMIRGKSFYAIWDEEKQLWSTDEYDVQRLVDKELYEYYKKFKETSTFDGHVELKTLAKFSTKMWTNFQTFIKNMADNSHQLDANLTFLNDKRSKTKYISRTLPYPLEDGSIDAYDELMSTLYDPEERVKLEWAIGAIIAGDAKDIQKFIVLYGEPGSGKGTFLNILQKLFTGYYTTFDAKSLTSNSNSFPTEVFKNNPLVAIQHDGDLSRIEDNSKLNSIISHEEMSIRELYKPSYTAKTNCFLFMGTNEPVKIKNAKSGLLRRLMDVSPSLRKINNKRYHVLMQQIDFELGGIASHCFKVYKSMGKNYYASYRPLNMIFQTNVFFNFVEENYYIFKEQDGVSLKQAYDIYKAYCDETLVEFKMPRHIFREELKSYFQKFLEVTRINDKQVRSYYSGFIIEKFTSVKGEEHDKDEKPISLVLDCETSIIDETFSDCKAQYATIKEIPELKWDEVNTKLKDINTHELHYVKPPIQHICIDFDLKDPKGNKSLELNLEAASKWPPTYAELSKGGAGIHLHYIYEGDVSKLSRVYEDGVEIKVFTGKSSLRRKLTKCNNLSIAVINSGLPLKGETMVNVESVKNEMNLRKLILRNLNKEIHPGTKPSIDFIHKILEDAYKSELHYDITDMRPQILAFANNSTNQADYCIKLVNKMKFASEEIREIVGEKEFYESDDLVFFDVEVFINLFIVVWKVTGKSKVYMINPSPAEIETLIKMKLVGFNNRRYDNHIIYARYLGYTNEQLFNLSQKIINGSHNCTFGEAYNLSYADVFDFAIEKQSLKKWEIALGLPHKELDLPWDQPVHEDKWQEVADYCGIDVDATEETFYARKQDFIARQIMADLSGLTVNDTTQMHAAKILFGNDKHPQDKFNYVDLSKMFPGYIYDHGKSTYREEITGEGGYVYAEPGMYANVAVLDIASMHPSSIIAMNMFGPYTKRYEEIYNGRLSIKHKDWAALESIIEGKFKKYITGDSKNVKGLSDALKNFLNSIYGFTSAKFENKFKDPRNKDNIVAKRGALFMIDLKHAVQKQGFQVVHIKTDSIKIPNATPEIIEFIMNFGKQYGYTFEHENTYTRFCLVNDAVYIARKDHAPWCDSHKVNYYYDMPAGEKNLDQDGVCNCSCYGEWEATGAQFAQPYVFKTLFSKEPIEFRDLCEPKAVKDSSIYLDMNENLQEGEHNYHFVGKVGLFCPIKSGCGGGELFRVKDDKYYAVTRSKGYRWLEAETVRELHKEEDIDEEYQIKLVDAAVRDISEFGDFEWFISDLMEPKPIVENPIGFDETPPPWLAPCGKDIKCMECLEESKCLYSIKPF